MRLEKLDYVSPGLCPCCLQCQSDYGLSEAEMSNLLGSGELADEGGFSWHDCESCGSDLGGDRYAAHAIGADGELVHLDVCVDCLLKLA